MLIVYEDIGMHCCLHHHYYHCCWGLVVNQQNHVLDCCVCCFVMFRMAIMVDRRCLCGFLVNLWRFMVVFWHCSGNSLWDWVHVSVFWSEMTHFYDGMVVVRSFWVTLVSVVSLLARVSRKDPCLGVWSVLQLFGLGLKVISFWVLGSAFQEPKPHIQPNTRTSSNLTWDTLDPCPKT